MMILRKIAVLGGMSVALMLGACTPASDSPEPPSGTGATVQQEQPVALPEVTGAKAGAYITLLLNGPTTTLGVPRPAASLGVFTSLYLAQGAFVPTASAMEGVDVIGKILLGQSTPESSETFAILKEFGSILQVDIIDTLNRSDERAQALEQYLRSLRNIMELANRKIGELEAREEELTRRQRDQRTLVRDMERTVSTALRDEDYELAGVKQEEVVDAKSQLAEIETELEQTQDILDPYNELMDIAEERVEAIEKNRAIIIAGLKVVEVPGIDELELIQEESSWRDRILPSNEGPSLFGPTP